MKSAPTNEGAVMPPLEAATIALVEIAESAREGLLALAVGTGLRVMQAWMNAVSRCCVGRGAGTTPSG
jgi:hypothetical protein